jgi:D-galactarolactone isomerase
MFQAGPPDYADATTVARSYVQAAPERCVWGSDWPHTGPSTKPDDAVLFDLLASWAPQEATRNRILVDNPEALYGFPPSELDSIPHTTGVSPGDA